MNKRLPELTNKRKRQIADGGASTDDSPLRHVGQAKHREAPMQYIEQRTDQTKNIAITNQFSPQPKFGKKENFKVINEHRKQQNDLRNGNIHSNGGIYSPDLILKKFKNI